VLWGYGYDGEFALVFEEKKKNYDQGGSQPVSITKSYQCTDIFAPLKVPQCTMKTREHLTMSS